MKKINITLIVPNYFKLESIVDALNHAMKRWIFKTDAESLSNHKAQILDESEIIILPTETF